MSDENERSGASAGSVAGGVVEHAKECVGFWRSMMEGADRIGMEQPSLAIGGVADLVDGLLAEIASPRLTDAEREALHKMRVHLYDISRDNAFIDEVCDDAKAACAAIDAFLERHK